MEYLLLPQNNRKAEGPIMKDVIPSTTAGYPECRHYLGRQLVTLLLSGVCTVGAAQACTLWAATGKWVEGGGTLIAKNRDWKPDHHQAIRIVHPRHGYAYIGLFAEGNSTPGLKAGTNQKGLTVLSASSNIPRLLRQNQPNKHSVMRKILTHYASIEELTREAGQIFTIARAGFFLISDSRQAMSVEVGLQGRFATHLITEGAIAHTNHYLDQALAGQFGDRPGISSTTRLARIRSLLDTENLPLSQRAFATMSRDRQDGPENSLWRHGREYTLASWIVETPAAGPPRLHLVLANPDEPESLQEMILDEQFWQEGKTRNPPSGLQEEKGLP